MSSRFQSWDLMAILFSSENVFPKSFCWRLILSLKVRACDSSWYWKSFCVHCSRSMKKLCCDSRVILWFLLISRSSASSFLSRVPYISAWWFWKDRNWWFDSGWWLDFLKCSLLASVRGIDVELRFFGEDGFFFVRTFDGRALTGWGDSTQGWVDGHAITVMDKVRLSPFLLSLQCFWWEFISDVWSGRATIEHSSESHVSRVYWVRFRLFSGKSISCRF